MPVLRHSPVGGGLFTRDSMDDYLQRKTEHIIDHTSRLAAFEFASRTEGELIEALYAKWEEHPVVLRPEEKRQLPPRDIRVNPSRFQNVLSRYAPTDAPGTLFTIAVPFRGGLQYLEMRPSWAGAPGHAEMVQHNQSDSGLPSGELHFKYEGIEATPGEILHLYHQDFDYVQRTLEVMRKKADAYNSSLRALLTTELNKRRTQLQSVAAVSSALSIPMQPREGAPKPFSVPVQEVVKLAPLPRTPRSAEQEWTLEELNYELILGVLRDLGRSMERTANAFEKMKEQHLRDIILFVLNGHFRGIGTGETFNADGKADIVMRWHERNAFVAECKYWDGRATLMEAVDQLRRYACWSDTKVTLLVITRHVEMSTVLAEIKEVLPKHEKSLSPLEQRAANEFRWILRHPTDEGAKLTMTVLVFNVRGARATRPRTNH